MKLNVSDIQRFSIGDGDGIRTTVFLKGCNLHCPWCHNPETISPKPQTLYYANRKPKTCGYLLTAREIFNIVIADKDFYDESGGGVTISGGEPLLQADGVAELCKLLKDNLITVIVDTAGSAAYSEFEKINKYVDEYYFDLKAATSEDYKNVIGGNFDSVIYNIAKSLSIGKKVRIRIPLIDGFNTSEAYSEKMCGVLKSVGAGTIDLLPFHRFGSSKYSALNLNYVYHSTPSMTKIRALEIAQVYKKHFANLKIEI